MKTLTVDNLTVSKWTTSPEIYDLKIRTEDRTRWLYINETNGFKLSDWTIEEAIKYYLSDEGKADRFDSWYRAWCD